MNSLPAIIMESVKPAQKNRAFALVELLVVISIVAAMVSVLLPAIHAARQSARNIECSNNMRQVGLAWLQYVDAHNGHLPKTSHAEQESWVKALLPFLEDSRVTYVCPLDNKRATRVDFGSTSYVINQYVSLPGPNSVDKLQQLKSTSNSITFMEGSDDRDPESVLNDHAHPMSWFGPTNVNNGRVWIAIQREIDPARHGVASNFLFADAHVRSVPSETVELWAILEQDFALPGLFPSLE